MITESVQYAEARLNDLAEIRRFVKNTSLKMGCANDAVSEIVLAANEAVTNILIYGYDRKPGCIEIDMCLEGADLIVYLRDRSPSFDPNSFPPPDITLPLELRKPGGMGIHMMRNFVDEMNYYEVADGVNELALVKRDAVKTMKIETET
ncbi:MAG: ATP-binding protein [Candidatus Promineifilaceae bacterium]